MPTQNAVFHFKAPTFISALITEIDSKLQELAAQNGKVAELERTLLELKEHEQRNTALLETLMDLLQQNGFVQFETPDPDFIQNGDGWLILPKILCAIHRLSNLKFKLI